jgi:hypothetical protein
MSPNNRNKILIKRSNLSSKVPDLSSLELGELGLNTADGKIFIKTQIDEIESIKEFLNSDEQYFTLNNELSGVNTKFGNNTISEVYASILGGSGNIIDGAASSIVNGENNKIESDFSSTVNGINNKIDIGADYSFIAGGQNNKISHTNAFTLGSNLSSHSDNFTYVNNISAQGAFYGDGSNLTGIIATGVVGPDTVVRSLTSNWESTYVTVSGLSALWASSSGEYLPLSGGTLTGTIIGDLSATGSYYGDGSKLTGIVAGDIEATNLVRSNSGYWDSTYTTLSSLSANWQTTFSASSAYVSSNPTGITGASALTKLIQITQAGYNSISPASDTLYIIVG